MIRRPSTSPDLGLDSLTDTMTNMMGLILLMVVITVIMSGGMRLVLLGELADPQGRTPVHVVCKDNRVLYMHKGDQWRRELERVCDSLASQLARKPNTSEALLEANRLRLCETDDFAATFVRERASEAGRRVFVIGIRFFPKPAVSSPTDLAQQVVTYSPAALRAIAEAEPDSHYLDAFVYESGAGALKALQARAKQLRLRLGWRPMLSQQTPGLSERGVPGAVGGEQ